MISEINKLKEENAKLNAIIDGYQPRLQALKVEIAELQAYKDVNEDFKTAWEELKEEINEYKKRSKCAWKCFEGTLCEEGEKYKQTLQEIKEIAEQCMNKDICYACKYVDDCYIEDAEIPTYDICKLLIQKITKAEEE